MASLDVYRQFLLLTSAGTVATIVAVIYTVSQDSSPSLPLRLLSFPKQADAAPLINYSNPKDSKLAYRQLKTFWDELERQGFHMELQDQLLPSDAQPLHHLQQCPSLLANGTLAQVLGQQLAQQYPVHRHISKTDIQQMNSSIRAALTMRVAPGIQDAELLQPPVMLQHSLEVYVNATKRNNSTLSTAFIPYQLRCKGGVCTEQDLKTDALWCRLLPSHEQHILSVDCGIIESCHMANATACHTFLDHSYATTYSTAGLVHTCTMGMAGFVKRTVRTRYNWQLQPWAQVQEFDELAAPGAFAFPAMPGHFPNEILPVLLLLDRLLPAHIPLLWPSGVRPRGGAHLGWMIPTKFLQALREENGLKPGRPIVELSYSKPILYRARRLYVFWAPQNLNSPPISWLAQKLVAHHFNALGRNHTERLYGQAVVQNVTTRAMYTAIVLMRGVNTSRSLANHAAVVAAMKDALGPEFEIDEYQPDGVWPAFERVNRACLMVSPHGANMNNMYYLNGNCKPAWVVEVGYIELDQGVSRFPPPDYVCLARNLGHKYILTFAKQGGYTSPLVANTKEIQEIALEYKNHVTTLASEQPL